MFTAEGRPRDLTTVRVVGIGDFADRGFSQLGLPGLMRRTIGSNIGNEPRLGALVEANEIEAYSFPQGVLSQLMREIAAGRPGRGHPGRAWHVRRSAPDGRQGERPGLHRVAKNKITDNYRKKKTGQFNNEVYGDEDLSMADVFLVDENNTETKELQQLFWETLFDALEELPKNQRDVFILNELEEKTLQQIADMQGVKLKTIISRKRYAVQHLRKRLEDLFNEFINY